jgi:histidine triad (HIT) family protein
VSGYDDQNIFAKMLRGEMPAHKVYEDETALAIMDIFPQSRGHMLVIPKSPSRNLLDADPAAVSAVMPTIQKLAKALKAATKADGLRLMQFNEAPAGQTVFHLHFHLIPVYSGIEPGRHAGSGRADDAELAAITRAVQALLPA